MDPNGQAMMEPMRIRSSLGQVAILLTIELVPLHRGKPDIAVEIFKRTRSLILLKKGNEDTLTVLGNDVVIDIKK